MNRTAILYYLFILIVLLKEYDYSLLLFDFHHNKKPHMRNNDLF